MDRRFQRRSQPWKNSFCFRNFKRYLNETTLHGLRFVGDANLTIWERLFFFCAFIAAVGTTAHLVAYIYSKWDSTPVIIGVNPYPVSISDIPFPAITLCNLNQLLRSKVEHYSNTSKERAMIEMACFQDAFEDEAEMPEHYKNNNLSLSKFILDHSQPCSQLIRNCEFSTQTYACSDLFREDVTDEGLCCVFNLLHPMFRYKDKYQVLRDYTNTDGAIPVAWDPEHGYQKDLPEKFYPRTARGIGVSMGLSLTLNAQLDDYYCSSTNGAGFKISLNSAIETPRVRDVGFIIGVGEEVRLRIEARSLSATRSIRALDPESRLCYFGDEGKDLAVYKFYTRRNCENECQARYVHSACHCIPYNLPRVFENATVCGAPQVYCVNMAQNKWLREKTGACREKCYSSCFDLTFGSTAYTAPLSDGNYMLQDDNVLRNFSPEYLRENIAVIHFHYREFVFHGNVRNVYVGFTEFLANSGGILGLFLGFSFISLAEAFYFAFLRPIFWWKRPITAKATNEASQKIKNPNEKAPPISSAHWLDRQTIHPRAEFISRTSPLSNVFGFAKKRALDPVATLKYNRQPAVRKALWN